MKEFKIIEVKEIKTKDNKTFNAFKTLDNKKKKMDVRFVRGCKNIPDSPCVICVEDNNCNVDTTRQYPILWIKDVVEIKELETKNNVELYF